MIGRVVAGIALAATAAACGGGSSPAKIAEGVPSAPASAKGTQVTVTETEFRIALSQSTFAPGVYTFVVRDSGHATHALEIDGPGVEDAKTAFLDSGSTAELTVTLQKGTYRLYCPVGNHADQGMDTKITVA